MIKLIARDLLPVLPANAALFLNFDGLLRHGSGPRLLGLILALRGRFQGALAIVTAQRLSMVDRMFAPVLLAGAGRSGAELRLHFNHPVQDGASGHAALPEALWALMAQPPFRGRVPVLASDDHASSALFAVQELGGLGIKLRASAKKLPDLIAHCWLRDGVSTVRAKRRAAKHHIPAALLKPPPLAQPLSA